MFYVYEFDYVNAKNIGQYVILAIMDKFEEAEQKGRRILETFLQQVDATDLQPTKDKYAPVDYYFKLKGQQIVAEIKVRDKRYEDYDTHLMEVSKYNSLVTEKRLKKAVAAYYINFFVDGETINAYWYETKDIHKSGIKETRYCNRTTAQYGGGTYKNLILIPKNKAYRFTFKNNKWQKTL